MDIDNIQEYGGIIAHAGKFDILLRTGANDEKYYQINHCKGVCSCGLDKRYIADIPEADVNISDLKETSKFSAALAIALNKYPEKVKK